VTRTTPSPDGGGDGDVGEGKDGEISASASSFHRDPAGAGGGIAITASCASRIRQLASSRPNPDAVYLRLYVDAGGCSGFQYKFLLLSEEEDGGGDSSNDGGDDGGEDGTIDPEEDVVFVRDGARVVVDQTSLDLLRGSTIDYVSEMIRSSFAVVGNPQSESACGCGSSFAVKSFESNPALD
jgi:Fe-S cluster assembly iron-binding protein IscA